MNLLAAFILAQAVTVNVDAAADRHRVHPHVYGLNFATTAQLQDLRVTLNRSGGNTTTRYNWKQNAANHANDWFYESLEHGPPVAGEETDNFIGDTKSGGAEPMITIPMIGWVAKMGPNRQRLASFSIAKYGAQQANDWQWFPDAGNGKRPDGSLITGNDPNDANMQVNAAYMGEWVEHLVTRWGNASGNGVRYYVLDNEPSIWHGTHRDVRPTAPTMDELWERIVDYGSTVKENDPDAIVLAPEEWGWSGYFMSGYDQQWSAANLQWSNTPDRLAHGGWDYLPWMLARLHEYRAYHGRPLVDVFTIHYYPQGGEYWPPNVSNDMQLRRNRSTRSLWDANYTDETWISDKVRLIPRFKEWIDRYYPGTPLGLTEYSWGADDHISGGIAQADVLGILGRENVDMATRWTTPETGTPPYNAFRMYRNYDGSGSGFGEISVRATAPNPDLVAAFAALRSDQALTVMLINKQLSTAASVSLQLANYTPGGSAQQWRMTSTGIARVADVAAGATLTLPPQSVTLLVFPGSADVIDPAIVLNEPTRSEEGLWTFTGTASDASGIASVKYHVSGTAPADGTATGTGSWSFGPIALQNGWNYVTVTAYDAAGNPRSVSRVVVDGLMTPAPYDPRKKRRAVR
ncbi:MAG TPA: glycoside hydrolase family 44 protein [Thermoanaerobaculia bacterium]|nr:glycoside hydrolase family 44 protein [Thermoanaerobaculia bacterium]